jgi:DNA-directed RNA polymerase specialized sigma24 family protein
MDEKTEELRDLFLDVSEDETVTESQQNAHGSLASDDEIDARLTSAVARMRDDLGFTTDVEDDVLAAIVRAYYEGADDEEIAANLDVDLPPQGVRAARLDLHLLRPEDTETDFDLAALRELADASPADAAESLDVDEATVETYRRVLRVRAHIQRTNARYPIEFEDALQDTQIADRLTHEARDDGLEEATEGQEIDVGF